MNNKYSVGDRVRFIGRNPDQYHGEAFVEKGEEVSEDEFLGEVGVITCVNPSNEEDLGDDGEPYYLVQYTSEYGEATGTLHESELLLESEPWTPEPLGQPSWINNADKWQVGDYVKVISEPEAWEGTGEDSADRAAFVGHIGVIIEVVDLDTPTPMCLVRFPWVSSAEARGVQRNIESRALTLVSRPDCALTETVYQNCW